MSIKSKIRSVHPRIQLWNDFFVGKELEDSIESIETSKSINEIAGTFNIQLKPNEGNIGKSSDWWYDRFDPQDVIGITIDSDRNKDSDGKDKGAQFLGLVDVPQKNNVYGGESPSRGVTISGRDFGAILLDDDLVNIREIFLEVKQDGAPTGQIASLYEATEKEIAEKLQGRHPCFTPQCLAGIGPTLATDKNIFTFMDATVTDAVQFIFDNCTSIRNLVYIDPKEKILVRDMIDGKTYVKQRPGYVCVQTANLSSYQGNLLNFIREVLDNDFNELMVDTKDGKSYLRVRPKPFDRTDDVVNGIKIPNGDPFSWESLKNFVDDEKYHEIENCDILEETLYRSKENVFSVFKANPAALNDLEEVFGFTLKRATVDLYNLLRYGFKKTEADIRTTYQGNDGKIIEDMFRECRDRLKNWNIYAPVYEKGTIKIKGNESIHVGDKIYLPQYKRSYISKEMTSGDESTVNCEGFEFYVTGVKQRWAQEENFLSTLAVERGQNAKLLSEYKKERDSILKYLANNIETLFPLMEAFKKW